MAISTFSNPIPALIDGLLQGHELGLRLRNQQMQEQAFKTNEALKNQQMSMQDIMNRQTLQENARPVSDAGTVDNPAGPDMAGALPGLPATPGAPAYARKADASRTVKYGGRSYEMKTPEEQQASALTRQTNGTQALEDAKARAQANSIRTLHENQLKLEGGGTPAQGLATMGVPDGTPLTRDELLHYTQAMQEHARGQQEIQKGYLLKTTPDEQVYDLSPQSQGVAPGQSGGMAGPGVPMDPITAPGGTAPTPGMMAPAGLQPTPGATTPPAAAAAPSTPNAPSMRLLAGGGSKRATGEFGAYLRASLMKSGFTEQNAPPDLVMKATTDYAQKAKDPADVEQARQMRGLTMQLTQAHLDQLKAQQGGNVVDYQPGSREYKVAQDLAYGKLTMQQFRSLTAYSRDTNKKMDIYQKAAELNPNFNPAQFEMGFNLAKNPKVQQQLASLDNVKQGIPDLLKFSDAASRSGAPLLNNFIQKGGVAVGGKKYSDFKTAQTAFADELSGALGYGSATDMSREMGFNMTNPNLSPQQFSSAIQNVIEPFMERKRGTLLNQMGVYGQPGMNPAAGPAPAAAPAPQQQGRGQGFAVTDPNGGVHTFPTQQAADNFKRQAGIQ